VETLLDLVQDLLLALGQAHLFLRCIFDSRIGDVKKNRIDELESERVALTDDITGTR